MKFKRNQLLIEDGNPLIFRQPANEKHNEITIAKIRFALRLDGMMDTDGITKKMIDLVSKKVASGYPKETNISFNYNRQAPAFLFTIKGRTTRKSGDEPNQELADRIAVAKCRASAATIGRKIADAISLALTAEAQKVTSASEFLSHLADRELEYIKKV